jgi:hypothetical protein
MLGSATYSPAVTAYIRLTREGDGPTTGQGRVQQVMSSLCVEDALENRLKTTKTTPRRKGLLEQDMPTSSSSSF